MTTKFLEPGGDADFNVQTTLHGGWWGSVNGGTAVTTDIVHGGHIKSIKYGANSTDYVQVSNLTISDAGARISWYIYINALPNGDASIMRFIKNDAATIIAKLKITSSGQYKITNASNTTISTELTAYLLTEDGFNILQEDGTKIVLEKSTIPIKTWVRLCISDIITDTTHNRFEFFQNGQNTLSVTNGTLTITTSAIFEFGNMDGNATLDSRTSDHYSDNSNALTDTGDIWVTAKRPFSNGTTNGFTAQIGSGGSGYGTGHSPQVNERPLSNTNGWSMVGAGSAVTEEYNIESASTGDIDISSYQLVDYLGWLDTKSTLSETATFILNGNTSNTIGLSNQEFRYILAAGSTTYPSGTGADIGIITDTTLTTVSLFECGILFAYIPVSILTPVISATSMFQLLGTGS